MLIVLILATAKGGVLILSTESNEGAFAVKDLEGGFCFVGRRSTGRHGYDALLGVCQGGGCKAFEVGTRQDDFSYSLETAGKHCLALLTLSYENSAHLALLSFNNRGVEKVISFGGAERDMGWYIKRVRDGYLVIGGVEGRDWDILAVKFDDNLLPLWARRFGTAHDEYGYSVAELKGLYYIVGRTSFRGNWDGFILVVDGNGNVVSSWVVGSDAKDYLRYVGLYEGRIIAVGRSEVGGTSDLLIVDPFNNRYRLIDGGDFDYGRFFVEGDGVIIVGGDTGGRGSLNGFFLTLTGDLKPLLGIELGGNDVESIRFMSEGGYFAGYTYSFSFDNDILIGRIDTHCSGFMKAIDFRQKGGRIDFFRFPVLVLDYPVKIYDEELKINSLSLEIFSACRRQE